MKYKKHFIINITLFLFVMSIPSYSYEQKPEEILGAIFKAVAQLKEHSKYKIKKIVIRNLPIHQSNGFTWDPLNGAPDVYFTLSTTDQPQSILFKSCVAANLDPLTNVNHSLGEQFPQINILPQDFFTFNDMNKMLLFKFYDKDVQGLNISQDDFMGLVVFNPKIYVNEPNKYPDWVLLKNENIDIKLELEWL
jgi:hypothetical protein